MTHTAIGIVVGASAESLHALTLARQLGLYTIAVDGSPAAPGLQAADEALVLDIRDPQNIIAALGQRRPAVVIPVPIGRYLISGAALNDYYGLPGVSRAAAELCTDKWAFYETLHPRGLRPGRCILLQSEADLPRMEAFPLPAVLKPRTGSGSRGVLLLQTEAQRAAVQATLRVEEDLLLEQAAPGTEYGLDAAVYAGQFTPLLLRKKINTPPPHCQCVGYLAQDPASALSARVAHAARQWVQALGLQNTLLHADVMVQPDGTVFPIELSARPSGHNLHNVFTPFVTGVDPVQQYLRAALGHPPAFAPTRFRPGMIRFFDFSDCIVRSVPDPASLRARYPLAEYQCNLRPGQYLGPVQDGSVMHRGYFVLQGQDEAALCAQADALLREFSLEAAKEAAQ